MSLVRAKTKSQVTLPDAIRRQLRVEVGDLLDAKIEKSSIVLWAKAAVDRDKYTPAQRSRIDAELAKASQSQGG